jgi:hypothetical protein
MTKTAFSAGGDGGRRAPEPPTQPARRVQKKKPRNEAGLRVRGGRSFFTRRLVAITTIYVDVGGAHIAASHWAVPFIRLGRVCGI